MCVEAGYSSLNFMNSINHKHCSHVARYTCRVSRQLSMRHEKLGTRIIILWAWFLLQTVLLALTNIVGIPSFGFGTPWNWVDVLRVALFFEGNVPGNVPLHGFENSLSTCPPPPFKLQSQFYSSELDKHNNYYNNYTHLSLTTAPCLDHWDWNIWNIFRDNYFFMPRGRTNAHAQQKLCKAFLSQIIAQINN